MDTNEVRYREIVVPGEEITRPGFKGGFGTFERNGQIFSSCLGYLKFNSRAGYVNVVPIRGRYFPRVGDKVIGKIVDAGPSTWTVDIEAPYPAPLHVNEAPWRVDYGEAAKYMAPGDSVLAQVSGVDDQRRIFLTMNQPGMKLLRGGRLVRIDHTKVPRIIGRGGSMINLLKKWTNTRIFVGQNGLLWIDGEVRDAENAVEAIRAVEASAAGQGLAGEIEAMLSHRYGRR